MKRHQLFCVFVTLGLSGTAFGQVTVARSMEFANGSGVLTARDGAQARIEFRVGQHGDNPAEGRLHFVAARPNGSTVTISTERLPRLQVRGDHAAFGGPAMLVVSGRDGWRWEGQVTVTIRNDQKLTDRRDGRIADIVEVAFTTDRTDRQYSFAGVTPPRNIEIGIRTGR